MKCSTCQAKAAIEIRRHSAAFCGSCFLTHLERQIQRTIESEKMLAPGERALVAGNLSLTWMYDPKDPKSPDRVRRLFDQQLDLQVEEGIDFVVCETYSFLGEALLAVERALKTGLPVMATMCFEKEPVTTDGKTPADCARALEDAGYCDGVRKLLESHGLGCWAISNHLVGQAVCDRIDERHRTLLPDYVWGDGDPYVTPRFGERLAARVRGELVLLRGCGHWWPLERPAEVAAALERFWAAAR